MIRIQKRLIRNTSIFSSVVATLVLSFFWLGFSTQKDPSEEVKPDDNRFTKTILAEKFKERARLRFMIQIRTL
jgi:hypothetical protein